jgi:hypothetical protein
MHRIERRRPQKRIDSTNRAATPQKCGYGSHKDQLPAPSRRASVARELAQRGSGPAVVRNQLPPNDETLAFIGVLADLRRRARAMGRAA